jgi:hypothetical protein
MIVEGEVVGRDRVDPLLPLELPVFRPQRLSDVEQRCAVRLAGPIGFKREFQFAMPSDPGKTEICSSDGHFPTP